MNVDQLKQLLHKEIDNIDDEELLLMMKEIVDSKDSNPYHAHLSQERIDRIEEGKADYRNGIYFTNEQADELVEKWLREK